MSGRAPNFEGSRYRQPSGTVARFLWRRKMWIEATFALSMLERWEKVFVCTVVLCLSLLFTTGLVQYLPHHLDFLRRRAIYYISGDEAGSAAAAVWPGPGQAATHVGAEL